MRKKNNKKNKERAGALSSLFGEELGERLFDFPLQMPLHNSRIQKQISLGSKYASFEGVWQSIEYQTIISFIWN